MVDNEIFSKGLMSENRDVNCCMWAQAPHTKNVSKNNISEIEIVHGAHCLAMNNATKC
jgi:hypothetical protein